MTTVGKIIQKITIPIECSSLTFPDHIYDDYADRKVELWTCLIYESPEISFNYVSIHGNGPKSCVLSHSWSNTLRPVCFYHVQGARNMTEEEKKIQIRKIEFVIKTASRISQIFLPNLLQRFKTFQGEEVFTLTG